MFDNDSDGIINQGRQFLSIPAPHTVTSPANCFIFGAVHPANALKSLKACKLSQCAYQRGTDPAEAQADVLPKIFCHCTADEQIAGVFPLALIALIVSVIKAQLLVASCPDHEHPALGFVSASIQIVVYKLLVIPLTSSLTCVVAFFPLHGNMQTSVANPAVLALARLAFAFVSNDPPERYARIIAKLLPAFLRQVKVAADVAVAISMPVTDRVCTRRKAEIIAMKSLFISQQLLIILHFSTFIQQPYQLKTTIKFQAMSQYGDSSYPQSQCSEPLPERSQFAAEESAFEIIQRILDRAIYRIGKNERFRQNLRKFSNMKSINNISEVNNLNFYQSKTHLSNFASAIQPIPLYVDSLLPISADIDKQNTYKLRLKNAIETETSQMLKNRKNGLQKSQEKKEQFLKLNIQTHQEQQDGFTKQLRKMQEDKEGKERLEKKVKDTLQRQEKERLKEKKKEKQEKLSYDYNGVLIKVRSQNKANLISKLINGNMDSKTAVNKQAFNDPNPQTVQSVVLGRKKNSLALSAIKKKDEVDFQQNRSLAEGVSVGVGVKYIYEGKTLQAKIKPVSIFQLKKTLNDRRLTKEQFQRIKSLNGSSLELINSQIDLRETKYKRSQSDAKLLKKAVKKVQKEKIVINNSKLRQKMLEKVNEMNEQINNKYGEQNPQRLYETVNKVDIFNMNYLKNSKGDKNTDNLSTERSLAVLPKIHKSMKSNKDKNLLPKQRQRIKQINTKIYQIRKKFDQKLQY